MLLSIGYVIVLGLLVIFILSSVVGLYCSVFRMNKGAGKKWYVLASLLALIFFLGFAFSVLQTWEEDRYALEKAQQTQDR